MKHQFKDHFVLSKLPQFSSQIYIQTEGYSCTDADGRETMLWVRVLIILETHHYKSVSSINKYCQNSDLWRSRQWVERWRVRHRCRGPPVSLSRGHRRRKRCWAEATAALPLRLLAPRRSRPGASRRVPSGNLGKYKKQP